MARIKTLSSEEQSWIESHERFVEIKKLHFIVRLTESSAQWWGKNSFEKALVSDIDRYEKGRHMLFLSGAIELA